MRLARSLLAAALLAALATGCGAQSVREASTATRSAKANASSVDAKTTTEEKRTEKEPGDVHFVPPPVATVDPSGVRPPAPEKKSEETKSAPPLVVAPTGDPAVPAPKTEVPPAAVAEAVVGTAKPKWSKEPAPPQGLLTAGSFDDNVDPVVFRSFAQKLGQLPGYGSIAGKLQGQRLLVLVSDSAGKPVGNARVKLAAGNGNAAELVTRSDGRAVFLTSWDNLPADQALVATVTPPEGGPVTDTITPGAPRWSVTLPRATAKLPKYLDLAFVIDTTGSMGDELKYLQSELRGISETVHKNYPQVQQRFALSVYRDEGDQYVTRSFPFTESIDVFLGHLAKQSASGGGDYPEAVHRGLEDAAQLQWREDDAARVLFHVADAPPHAQHAARALAVADALRRRGIALYPVACSGYDDACEGFMRTCALLTGSQFLFLTDDSGVGGAHGEPRIPYYQVERLNRLMARMIAGELSGRRIDAEPGDVIRTVGRRPN